MNRVKELRIRAGMQQKELAIALNVQQPSVSRWEQQKADPTDENVTKLAMIFGVPEEDIIYYAPANKQHPSASGLTDEDLAKIAEYMQRTRSENASGVPKTRQARILAANIDRLPEAERNKALALYDLIFANYAPFFNDERKEDDDT